LYTREQFSKLIDNTYLKSSATKEEMIRFLEDAKRHHFAAAVVFPYWVPLAVRLLQDTDVKVCTPIGFPYGTVTRSTKVYEARNAVSNGAEELDVVMNVAALKSGDIEYVQREMSEIVSAAQLSGLTEDSKRTLIKIIIETPVLTREEKITACEIVRDSGADFIKTSTGTAGNGGALLEDIHLIRTILGPTVGVKAAGGIRTVEHAMDLLDAGANRLGTSTGIQLVEMYNPEELLRTAQ